MILPIRDQCEDDYWPSCCKFTFLNFFCFNSEMLYIYNLYCVLSCEDYHIMILSYLQFEVLNCL